MKNINKIKNNKINVTQFAKNCFTIDLNEGVILRHYDSNIVFIPRDEDVIYLGMDYDYSATTSKFRNKFLNMTTKQINDGIKNKSIIIDTGL